MIVYLIASPSDALLQQLGFGAYLDGQPAIATPQEGAFYAFHRGDGNVGHAWISPDAGYIATEWGADPDWFHLPAADYPDEDAMIAAALDGQLSPV